MKKILAILLSLLLVGLFTMCKDDDKTEDPTDNGPAAIVAPTGTVVLSGVVSDATGAPLSGATVTAGSETTSTGYDGTFIINAAPIVSNRVIASVSKDGYFDVVKSKAFVAGSKYSIINTALQIKDGSNDASTTFTSAAGGVLNIGSASVTIPGSGLKVDATGSAFTGTATIETFYLAPDNAKLAELMPGGDLAGVNSSDADVALISYGMLNVKLSDGSGNKLQIADGKTATVKIPVIASMQSGAPATMPLWTFDVAKGVWVEEGVATLDAGGQFYEGTVSHFSWVNLDYPELRATVKGTVTDAAGKALQGVKVTIDQVCRHTDKDGKYEAFVPANTALSVSIKSDDYFGQSIGSQSVAGMSGGGETIVNFNLPTMPKVIGTVSSCTSTDGEEAIICINYYDSKNITICGMTTNGSFEIPVSNNITSVDITAIRYGNSGNTTATTTAVNTNFDAGNIEVCTPIVTGPNSVRLNGVSYTDQAFNFDGINGASYMEEGVGFSMFNINLVSAATKANTYGGIAAIYQTNLNLYNLSSTGTYTYPPTDYNGPYFDFNINIDGDYLYVNTGTLTLTNIGSVGGLIEGTVEGTVGDSIAPISATINFSVLRNPDQEGYNTMMQ